ncbi:hypothetical protein [Dysgonomonas sp. GY617]|uniref:hypothetical protein n=1 Tax=Dysgonomonas sp. GY617 TaxID=2780420 RepID=UPI001883A50E|nr:hypothetical protein [Dysgonomonas sp. GY617]MBF0575992.1 hypothetical protein [Dysgonomonas sp. GY617]
MFRILLPIDRYETILFLLYGIIATFFATQTNITDQIEGKADAYFSFDFAYIFHHVIQNVEGPSTTQFIYISDHLYRYCS